MEVDGEQDWDQLNKSNWRGLGLSDPIRSVEVRDCSRLRATRPIVVFFRINGSFFLLF